MTGVPGLEASVNPFKRPHKPSVFSEAINDNTQSIPQNRELFENVIKEAFSELLQSIEVGAVVNNQKDTTDALFEKIR